MKPVTHLLLRRPEGNLDLLRPLLRRRPLSLLPLLDRPLLHYQLSVAAAAGVREASIECSDEDWQAIVNTAGEGERWGLHLMRARPPSTSDHSTSDHSAAVPLNWLPHAESLALLAPDAPDALGGTRHPAEFLRTALMIDSPRAYWRAACALLAAGPLLDMAEVECAHRRYISSRCQLAPSAALHGELHISQGTQIGPRVDLGSCAFVGRNAVLDADVLAHRTVVLDDTYVGQWADISGKIADGTTLIDIDSGIAIEIDDALMLSVIAPAPSSLGRWLGRWLH